MKNLFIVFIVLFFTHNFFAATLIFEQNVDEDWSNPSNWSTGTVPTSNDIVYITFPNTNAFIPQGYTAYAKKIRVGGGNNLLVKKGAILDVANTINLYGSINNEGRMEVKNINIGFIYNYGNVYGSLINDGIIEFKDEIITRIYIYNGEVINNSTIFQVHNTGSYDFITISPTSQFINHGTLEKYSYARAFIKNKGLFVNESSGEILFLKAKAVQSNIQYPIIDNQGEFINKGELTIDEEGIDGYLMGIKMSNGSSFLNTEDAYLSIRNAQEDPIFMADNTVFHNYGFARFQRSDAYNRMIRGANSNSNEWINFQGSYFLGGGHVRNVNPIFYESIISPMGFNHLYGKISFFTEVELNGSLFKCQIGGNSGSGNNNGHDQIHSPNKLNIDGVFIEVTLLSGFIPNIGDEYVIVTADDNMGGNIDDIDLPALPSGRKWEVQIESSKITLKVVYSSSSLAAQNTNQISTQKNKGKTTNSTSELFPNPFSSTINIKVPAEEFSIYNTLGKLIYQSNKSNETVNLANLKTGIYFVHFEMEGKNNIEKIIKID